MTTSSPHLLREIDAATYLGLASGELLARWRWAGKGPAFHKLGSAVRYSVQELDSFISWRGGCTMNAMSAAAADYAGQGLAVLPLRPRSKVPATSHGKKDATSDPQQVADWFPPDTNRNVGILTGERSRLLVLDIDPRNGGDASFERFERTYGPLPATKRAITGGGGFHLFFRLPEGATGLSDHPSVADFEGVDIKCDGYVVAAPSVHPDTGKSYAWDAADLPIADAPEHLIELARGGKRFRSAAPPSHGAIAEGGRNSAMTSLAGSLRAKGLGEEAIRAALLAENKERCNPPLDDAEIEGIARSVARYAAGRPTLKPSWVTPVG